MKFCELTKDEFRKFADAHPLKSYLQTPEMAQLKVMDNWEEHYVGVKESEKLVCATMMISYNGRIGKYFNAPRGYLIDFRNKELLSFFTKEIKKYLKKHGGYVLKIEPKVFYKERDINGNIVDNGFDNTDIYNNLINLGYKHGGFYEILDLSKQVRWAFILDISNKTEEAVFNQFKSNTRNIIRKAMKSSITVRELEYEELNKFKELVESSGSRKHFHGRELEYYQKMYKLFNPKKQIKFLVAEINFDDYISTNEKEVELYTAKISKLNLQKDNSKKKEYETQIQNLCERINEAKTLKTQYGNNPIMAGGMFMLYGKEIVYLYSGSRSEFMHYQSQFLVQWEIIKYGINNNYDVYNFYGINGRFTKDDDRYGVYTFKKGFGGTVVEYLGDFDLIVSPGKYFLHKVIDKLK